MTSAVDVKVPLEALSYRFRKIQKHLSKEVEAEIKNVISLQQDFDEDKYKAIKTRLALLQELATASDVEEKECVSRIVTRVTTLLERPLSLDDKTMIYVADYLLRSRKFECVDEMIQECGADWIQAFLDIREHREAAVVEDAISAGDLSVATRWCQSHGSKLRRLNSTLEFYIAQEHFLDLVYENKPLEALSYAQDHLTVLINIESEGKSVKNSSHFVVDGLGSTDEKRQRACSMGSYHGRSANSKPAVGIKADTIVVNSNSSVEQNSSIEHHTSLGDEGDELKTVMRHLTGLLVYPCSSPEVMDHPRFGPKLRSSRLHGILELFQRDFRRVYGVPEISPFETYLSTGISVLKTPSCMTVLNGFDNNTNDDITQYSAARERSTNRHARAANGISTWNRFVNRSISRSSRFSPGRSAARASGPVNNRGSGRFFSSIGSILGTSSNRIRSQSMSAVEEIYQTKANQVKVSSDSFPCDGGDQKNISYEEITGPLHKKMPEHPCYHPCLVSDRSGVNLKRDDTMVSGKRRAEECPICSSNGVGVAVARAVPSFPPPLSVLVCRGSGAVMSHENPPMALPNGQVFSRDFLLATSIKRCHPRKHVEQSTTSSEVAYRSPWLDVLSRLADRAATARRASTDQDLPAVPPRSSRVTSDETSRSYGRSVISSDPPPVLALTRGADGILRSRSEAVEGRASTRIRVSPIHASPENEFAQMSGPDTYINARSDSQNEQMELVGDDDDEEVSHASSDDSDELSAEEIYDDDGNSTSEEEDVNDSKESSVKDDTDDGWTEYAVCPISGDQFDFSTLRTVFLA